MELQDFPVMTKGDFIENYDQVLVDNSKEQGNLYRLSTSGSTGTPFTVLCDGDKMSRVNMNFISCMELNGFRMGMKRGEFRAWIKGKNTISKWKSFKNNLIMVDISNMGRRFPGQNLPGYRETEDTGAGYVFQCADSTDTVHQKNRKRHQQVVSGDGFFHGRGTAAGDL